MPGETRRAGLRPVILVASSDLVDHAWLRRCVGDAAQVTGAVAAADVLAAAGNADLIVIGEALSGGAPAELAEQIDDMAEPVPRVRLGDARSIPPAASVAYVLPRQLEFGPAAALLLSLAGGRLPATTRVPLPRALDADEARRREQAFSVSRRVAAATDLAGAETAASTALLDLLGAERAYCLFFDAAHGEVWSAERDGDVLAREHRADRGLVGWAARTGSAARCARAGTDPRWWAAIDDPAGRGDERLLVQPAVGLDQEIHAVLVAVRSAARPEFRDGEAASLRAFAGFAGPLLEQLAWSVEASTYLEEARGDALFRAEAMDAAAPRRWGDVVRVAPSWIRWAHAGVIATMIAAAVLLVAGRMHTYSRGPAVVRMEARDEVTARSAGSVAAIVASAGTRVKAGDVLARLDDAAQAAEVARLERELEARLRERLLGPSDPATGEAVSRLRLELERSRAALDERLVRAPTGGVVGEVRVRPGQQVDPGDVVASVVDPGAEAGVIAFLPGGDRPRLDRGQRVRLQLAGYPGAYQDLVVEEVAAEAMGPEEARRYLGRIAGDVELRGPVVLVRARLAREFAADGVIYRYIDGMGGHVEVELASERLLEALLPGLRRL